MQPNSNLDQNKHLYDSANTPPQTDVLFSSKAWYNPGATIFSPIEGTLSITSDATTFIKKGGESVFDLKFSDTKEVESLAYDYLKFFRNPDGKYDISFSNPAKAKYFWTPNTRYAAYTTAKECVAVLQSRVSVEPLKDFDKVATKANWLYYIIGNTIGAAFLILIFTNVYL